MRQRRLDVLAGVALILATHGTARAEVKDATAGGFTLENDVRVPVEPMTAWKALVDDVDRWWPADHTWWGARASSRSSRGREAASASATANGRLCTCW